MDQAIAVTVPTSDTTEPADALVGLGVDRRTAVGGATGLKVGGAGLVAMGWAVVVGAATGVAAGWAVVGGAVTGMAAVEVGALVALLVEVTGAAVWGVVVGVAVASTEDGLAVKFTSF